MGHESLILFYICAAFDIYLIFTSLHGCQITLRELVLCTVGIMRMIYWMSKKFAYYEQKSSTLQSIFISDHLSTEPEFDLK